MRKKLLLGLSILVTSLSIYGCGKSTDADNQAATESYETVGYNSAQVEASDESLKAELNEGNVSISIGDIDGYTRSFGNDAYIEYMSTEGSGSVSYQIYGYNKVDQVKNIIVDYASNEEYHNNLTNQSEQVYKSSNGNEYNLLSLEYTSDDVTTYSYVYLSQITDSEVLCINLTSTSPIDDSSFVVDAVKINIKESVTEESSEASSDKMTEDSNDNSSEKITEESEE